MDDTRLDDLLDQYQELLDSGRVPNLSDLCRECPDLRDELGRRVVRLHRLGALLGDVPTVPTQEPEPLSLSEDKTWVSGQAAGAEPTLRRDPGPAGVRDPGAARRGRHGRRLQGPANRPEPAGRTESDPARGLTLIATSRCSVSSTAR